jgi:Tol biopolymer transport system component
MRISFGDTGTAMRTTARTTAAITGGVLVAVTAAALLVGCGGQPEQDTRLIVFARAPATNTFSNLYLLQTDGSLRRLTRGGIDSMPAWSPDGRQIAFQRAHRGKASLYVANADGSGQRLLPDPISGDVDWSPDGRHILIGDSGRLYVTNTDWTGRKLLLDPAPARAEEPRWSPDGNQIVFALGRNPGSADVYVMDADGTGTKRLTRLGPGKGWPSSPSWSPDGSRIAFLLPGSLDVMNADGSGEQVLRRFPNGIFPSSLAWSPDGETIAFALLKLGPNRHASGIYLLQADGSALHRLTRDIDSNPSWSPDGRQLVFQRLTGFHISQITLMDRDGSNQVLLTEGGWSDSEPAWRPSVE